jgi:hypothetical protein
MRETGPRIREILGRRGAYGGVGRMARILRGDIRWADLNPVRGNLGDVVDYVE